jgi:hypothetical protein
VEARILPQLSPALGVTWDDRMTKKSIGPDLAGDATRPRPISRAGGWAAHVREFGGHEEYGIHL